MKFENLSKRWQRFWLCAICCGFMLMGGIFLFIGGRDLNLALRSRAWPVVQGTILTSQIVECDETYSPDVTYQYAVSGRSYTGRNIYGGGGGGDSWVSHAQAIVDRHPPGLKVLVHYDPDDPGQAVLEPGLNIRAFLAPGIGLIFFLFGLFAMWGITRHYGKVPPKEA